MYLQLCLVYFPHGYLIFFQFYRQSSESPLKETITLSELILPPCTRSTFISAHSLQTDNKLKNKYSRFLACVYTTSTALVNQISYWGVFYIYTRSRPKRPRKSRIGRNVCKVIYQWHVDVFESHIQVKILSPG